MAKTDFKSVNEYIASQPKTRQPILKQVRGAIRKAVPEAQEGISYQIPTYKLNGRMVICFAGWKEHYSLYPASDRLAQAFETDLAPYKRSKGTIRFPLSQPVPADLIRSIAKFRAKEVLGRDKTPRGTGKKGRSLSANEQLERVRRMCSEITGVSEKLSHGAPSFFVEKDKGMFVVFMDNHHSDGHLAVWLPVPAGLQAPMISDAPATYFKPPYLGSSGWVGIELAQIRDEALAIHIRQAWELIARKKKTKHSTA